ncbi:bifunctional UDP-N-acetylmuramoyl-L-alanyl-D-glutamate--2,6-diaminopimelate ligase MurE/UDP-N-acetylmuramoyl-tripeptide--D-alanyl-D-alanine ligase MurF [Kerstersia similis]|uniref:bifunctional UDP-N-acetylmuramoyl-L-alanyl-D-glutamate--2, 6-diaminopimelate ligase MurE/UDP-N-acetylmuramoyl-tripeptide--D-alanyl-D-alanine ligase MurF n=1 Tax=Kerstersia similis TaxID=206505 RepID=UPI0039EDFB30
MTQARNLVLHGIDSVLGWLRQQVSAQADLHLDSRRLRAGDVFLAVPGVRGDGREHIAAARAAGAWVLADTADRPSGAPWPVDQGEADAGLAWVPGLKALLGSIAHEWYGQPSQHLAVVAVTGTNGKTSCAYWIADALAGAGMPCGVLGTLGTRWPDGSSEAGNLTTPDVVSVHRTLAAQRAAGAQAVAMEASSIGIEQGRMDQVQLRVAAWTNLSRDHLDYHGSMEAYAAAKEALFRFPGLQSVVINQDDAAGRAAHGRLPAGLDVWTYAVAGSVADGAAPARLAAQMAVPPAADGLAFALLERAPEPAQAAVSSQLLGEHNIENMLLVAGVLRALGLDLTAAATQLAQLRPVPGRLERVVAPGQDAARQALVVVDYAHTPDALARTVQALAPLAQRRGGRLLCLFGCGGDRDPGKRPLMAQAALAAERVIVTSDNPRSEAPDAIIAQILAGVPVERQVEVMADRAEAILHAIWSSSPADVILLAGKGHETYQEIQGQRHVFDDREWARLALWWGAGRDAAIDARKLVAGEVFVALAGERADGHDYVAQAEAAGAAAALVAHPVAGVALPQFVLGDGRAVLARLATAWRRRFDIPVIAVTGSNGKTTTKEMIAAVLAAWVGEAARLATRGNLNNELGVPMTLLRLRAGHRAAVIELGMNHPGEIAVLAAMAQPTVALVNNAQREHQEFMKSVAAVAEENGAVLAALPASGVAVYPADDAHAAVWDGLSGTRRKSRFALSGAAELMAADPQVTPAGVSASVSLPDGTVLTLATAVPGVHNLRNAMAALACTLAVGVPAATALHALAAFAPVAGRMHARRLAAGVWLIDDSYNANADSVRAAIDVLGSVPGPRVLVLGDMGEVGDQGPAMHEEVGAYAASRGVDVLVAMGELSRRAVAAFGVGAVWVDSTEAAMTAVRAAQPAVVLVKGSRFMHMEKIVAACVAEWDNGEAAHHVA